MKKYSRKEIRYLTSLIDRETDPARKYDLISQKCKLIKDSGGSGRGAKERPRKGWALSGAENVSHPIFYSGGPRK